MNPISAILDQYGVMVLDGALATELERRGCDLHDPLWSAKVLIEAPAVIKAVHTAYLEAGADCITTATYQATFEGFAQRGLSKREALDLMVLAVELALEARDEFWSAHRNRVGRPRPLVAASIGPYGAYLADGSEYRGDYGLTRAELAEFHRERLSLLAGSGADVIACETVPSLLEAEALADLLNRIPDVSAWVSFSARDGRRTSSGDAISLCARRLDSSAAIGAIGINCTPPHRIPSLIDALREGTQKPIVVYPNSGEIYDAGRGEWFGSGETAGYAADAALWYERGARIVGGCCRTGPAEIKSVATRLRG